MEIEQTLEVRVRAPEAEAAQLRSTLPSQSATALADELHRLLIRAADGAEELADLAPASPALVRLKSRLVDAFVALSEAARELNPYWQDEGEVTRYRGATGTDCGYNKAIDHGYSFGFRDLASGRRASVNVEAAAGAELTEDAAHLALWGYRKEKELPSRIVLGTDGGFRRA